MSTEENIEKNIEAIEKEKKEYLENNSETDTESQEDEEKEVEVFEFSLDEDEINELIANLVELKHTKTNFTFEVDDDNDLLIHYEDEEEAEGDE